MGKCKFCNKKSDLISNVLNVCRDCILNEDWGAIKDHIIKIHKSVREQVDLPIEPPKAQENIQIKCNHCINHCVLSDRDVSYCGLRDPQKESNGTLPFPSRSKGYIHGYLDLNPTNCCNSWFCPAATSAGYPEFSNFEGPERGTHSYAAFLYGCTFNCLFCQNWSHKIISKSHFVNAEEIVSQIAKNKDITCICYFGGTPESQLPFTINLSKKILKKVKKDDPSRIMRVCWEWNGSGNPKLAEECMKIALESGGNIKFDLKSFNEKLNLALCGVSNRRTLKNFTNLAETYFGTRNNLFEISACTLMVPDYVNHEEIELIAKFISEINPKIPYSLLVFHGNYKMKDLPITPRKQANNCLKIAKKYLENVHLGNKFLLS
ncbi:MAG: radical SAM protein [Candidatus Lokiarchaeota archaeon]|nr:radical SAM protein [Candidatus Lokiarchaeota archaeon]MBD3339978.1 radical SAM protein [Candidatus Lokiarchaeota archaeon]